MVKFQEFLTKNFPSNYFSRMATRTIKTTTAEPILVISPEALVIADAVLKGRITFGAGTVIHPKAVINAGNGEIIFGANNIVEETAVIENLGSDEDEHVMIIGNDNLFETGSVCHAEKVGNNNILEIKCMVGPKVEISDGCRIGPKCEVFTEGKLPDLTLVYGEQNLRRIATEKPVSLRSQAELSSKLMLKYNHAFQNKR